jgi:hypothetical protein
MYNGGDTVGDGNQPEDPSNKDSLADLSDEVEVSESYHRQPSALAR